MPPKKMTANPLQPARYRPGKAHADTLSEDSSEEEEEEEAPKPAPPKAASFKSQPKPARSDLPARHRPPPPTVAAARQNLAEGYETASDESSDPDSESESGSESEDASSSEEEEEVPQRPLIRPVFVKKNQRIAATAPTKSYEEIEAEAAERRQAQADAMLKEQLELAAAAKAAGRKNWDDEDNIGEEQFVDDADIASEWASDFAAWKVRELHRIKRERAAIETAEAERAEIERRRNMSAAEREAEDREFLEKQKEERGERGNMSYMQKYFHKGAFFQDDLKASGVDRRDLMGAKFEDATNREILPEYMQIRDMTKLGKKSRTKYRDMKSEDTGRWGDLDTRRGPGKDWGVDERFRSDGPEGRGRGGATVTGANSGPLGERKRGGEDEDRSGKRVRIDD